jgi:ribonucleoside-diphosphate reductase subunit M1
MQPPAPKKMVTKRDGSHQEFQIDKIKARINNLTEGLAVDHMGIDICIKKIINYAHSGITSNEVDNLLAETAAYLNMLHPDNGRLAARIAVTNLHKRTKDKFSEVVDILYHYKGHNDENASLIADDVY